MKHEGRAASRTRRNVDDPRDVAGAHRHALPAGLEVAQLLLRWHPRSWGMLDESVSEKKKTDMRKPRETKDIVVELEALAEKLPKEQQALLDEGIGRFKAMWGAHEYQVRLNNRLNKQILTLAGELENPATQQGRGGSAHKGQQEFPGYRARP